MVDGWLSTDSHGVVRFFDGVPIMNDFGDWIYHYPPTWGVVLWKKTYDLKPPKPGGKFYVSIEL